MLTFYQYTDLHEVALVHNRLSVVRDGVVEAEAGRGLAEAGTRVRHRGDSSPLVS